MRRKDNQRENVLFRKDVDVFGPAGDELVGVGARKSARSLPPAAVAELGELFVEVGAEDVDLVPRFAVRGFPAGAPAPVAGGHRPVFEHNVFKEDVDHVIVQKF